MAVGEDEWLTEVAARYERDGFVHLPGLFGADYLEPVRGRWRGSGAA